MRSANDKSIEGSLAFAVFAFLASSLFVFLYSLVGFSALTVAQAAPSLLRISFAAAIVELLPIGDDNLSVPLSSALFAMLWLPSN